MDNVIRSRTYKDSDEIPLNGGQIESYSSLFDRSYDTSFSGLSDANVFNITTNTGTIDYEDNLYKFSTDSNNELIWTTPNTYNIINNTFSVEFGISFKNLSDGSDVVYFKMQNGGGDYYEFDYNYDSTIDTYELNLVFSSSTSGYSFTETKSINQNSNLDFRLVFDSEDNFIYHFIKIDDDWSLLKKIDIPAYSTSSNKSFNFQIGSKCKENVDILFNDFLFRPTVSGVPDEVFDKFLNNIDYRDDGYELFDCIPQYPGTFSVKVWGSGNEIGNNFEDTIIVLNSNNDFDETSFLSTPVEEYSVENEQSVCPNYLQNKDSSAIDVSLKCVCNSSGSFGVRFNQGGRLKKKGKDFTPFSGSFPQPELQYTENNNVYGKNFDVKDFGLGVKFDDILDELSIPEASIRVSRSIKMENNDICFYGVISQEYFKHNASNTEREYKLQNINFDFNSISGADSYSWEIGDARTGRIIRRNYNFSSGSPSLPVDLELEPGFYYFTVQGGNGSVYLGDKSNNNKLASVNNLDQLYSSDWNNGKQDHKMFFRVKEFRGYPFIIYYNFCEGSFQKKILKSQNNKEVSLRSYSISAVENVDGNVALIYDEAQDYDMINNRSNKLKYRLYEPSSNSFINSGKITFPESIVSDSEYFHSFDVCKEEVEGDFINYRFVVNTGKQSPYSEQYKFFSPFLDELPSSFVLQNHKSHLRPYDMEFDGDIVVNETKEGLNRINLNSLETFYLNAVSLNIAGTVTDRALFNEIYINQDVNHNMYPYFGDFINLDYDDKRNGILLSLLNFRNHAPLVKYLEKDNQKEISLPRFFDFYKDGSSTLVEIKRQVENDETFEFDHAIRYTDIGSIDSSFSNDGLIYSLACKEFSYPNINEFFDSGSVETVFYGSFWSFAAQSPLVDGHVLAVGQKFLLNLNYPSVNFSSVPPNHEDNGIYKVDSIVSRTIQDLEYDAASGSDRVFGIEYIDPETNSSSLSLSVKNPSDSTEPMEITVNLATDSNGDLDISANNASNIRDKINNNSIVNSVAQATLVGSDVPQDPTSLKYIYISSSRVSYYDSSSEVNYGDRIYINEGDEYGDTYHVQVNEGPITLGSTLLSYRDKGWYEAWEKRNIELGLINSNRILSDSNVIQVESDNFVGNQRSNTFTEFSGQIAKFDTDVGVSDEKMRFKSFLTVPVLNMYNTGDYSTNASRYVYGDINRFYNYNILSFGTNLDHRTVDTSFYTLFNQEKEDTFQVPLDEVLEVGYQDQTSYNINNVSYEENDELLDYFKLNSSVNQPQISREIDSQGTMKQNKRSRTADEGYRFRVDFEPILNGGTFNDTDRFEENLVFEAECYGQIDFGDLTKSRVQMVYDGINVDCRVYDFNKDRFVSVGYITDVDNQRVQEFDIILKHVDQSDGFYNVMFIVKDNTYINNVVKSDNHNFNFVTTSKDLTDKGRLKYVDYDSSLKTNYKVYFDNDYKDYNDSANIYKMGWTHINKRDDVQGNGLIQKNVEGNSSEINEGYIELKGIDYYIFDDSDIFTKGGVNYYPYGYKTAQRSPASFESFDYHWPEGYIFNIENGNKKVFLGEEFDLINRNVSDISNLKKDNLHSFYTSKDDTSDLIIYSDSENNSLDKYIYDTIVVKGVNVPKLDILARDDSQNAWSKVDEIDLRNHKISKTHIVNLSNFTIDGQNKVVIRLKEGGFVSNYFNEFDNYLYNGNESGKITEVRDNEIVLNTNSQWSLSSFDDIIYIFSDSHVFSFNNERENKQVGVRFNSSYNTYEGYYKINFVDFGKDMKIPLKWNHDVGSGDIFSIKVNSDYVYDSQAYGTDDSYFIKQFDLEYSIIDKETLDKIKSLAQKVGFNKKPIYIMEGQEAYPEKVYLCFMSQEISSQPIRDWGGEKLYNASMSFRSIE